MKSFKKLSSALYAGVALATLIPAAPAFAQEATTAAAEPGLDEIVVTARRREESLQDVPVAVSAFTAENFELRGSPDITQLQAITPNLTMQVARGSNSTLIAFIRGVGQQDPLWGFEPGVGLYVDDVYVARPQGAVLDIFDIERIEVLRGPQGTLYGRNTIGGAVKYVTKRLGDEPQLRLKANFGSYYQRDIIAAGDLPLNDKVAVGGAIAVLKRDGFGKNLNTGAEHYNKDVVAGRLSAEFKPTDNLFIRLSADRTEDDSNPRHGHREIASLPTDPAVLRDVYDTNAGIGDENSVMTQGVSATVEYTVNDQVTLKSITAYRDGRTDTLIDFDNTPAPTLDIPAFYKDDQTTQEFQILYTGDWVQGVAGIFYLNGSAAGAFDTVVGNANLTTLSSGSVDTESWAGFADVSFDITDQFKASLGARYTWDDKEANVFRAQYLGIRSPAFSNGAPRPLLATRTNYTRDNSFDEFTPRVSLSYEATEDLTVYTAYSKGFKSGGFDMRGDAVATPNTVNGYEPEKVDSYELGLKGRLGNRVTFNTAGFYSDYSGQQVTTQVPAGTTIASFVDNVGDSKIYGFEFEGAVAITDALTASTAIGYTHADFKKFIQFDLVSRQFIDVSDSRVFQNTPKWNGNVTLTYTHGLADGAGALTFTGSSSYRSSYNLFETPSAIDQDSYYLFDASVVWTSESGDFNVGLHARNLTDEQYRVGGYLFPGALLGNSIIGYYGPPRTFTASVGVKF
ncbi:MAG TPA: TonB-dependent receptor [Azospirillaceae bacterium]|nr:TonB-dependent receptor [Azospirillaceae bacterium]